MKVKEIPVVCVIKAEKPTTKQSMKVLDINVMAAIIKQNGKTHLNVL